MDNDERDDRLFGIFALSLAVAGSVLPFLIFGISGQDAAGGFLVVSLILAVILGIIGRKSKPGLIAIIIAAAAMIFILVMSLMMVA